MHLRFREIFAALLLLAAAPPFPPAFAQPRDADLCRNAIAATERTTGVPDRLLQAIGLQESGRRDPASGVVSPWPWTINVEGKGELFDTKQQAIAAVNAYRARGARSIDIGCMQINMIHHGQAFSSLEEAFDPVANTRYAAQFLQQLLDKTGSWPLAVAGYHSLTPDIGGDYSRRVLAIWAKPDLGRRLATAQATARANGPAAGASVIPVSRQASASGSLLPSSPVAALPAGAPARLLPMPGSGGSTLTGRGLDSYRAIPTQLTAMSLLRRS